MFQLRKPRVLQLVLYKKEIWKYNPIILYPYHHLDKLLLISIPRDKTDDFLCCVLTFCVHDNRVSNNQFTVVGYYGVAYKVAIFRVFSRFSRFPVIPQTLFTFLISNIICIYFPPLYIITGEKLTFLQTSSDHVPGWLRVDPLLIHAILSF